MSRSQFQVLFLLALMALPACGKSVKKFNDKILGKKESKPAHFAIDLASLPGLYTISGFQGRSGAVSVHVYAPDVVTPHQEAWRITATTIEVFSVIRTSLSCGERSYSLEGETVLALAATPTCPEARLQFISQQGSSSFSFRREPLAIKNWTFDLVDFTRRTPGELPEELYKWDTDFAQAPQWLAPYLPVEATLAAIATARAGFKDAAMVGATLRSSADLTEALAKNDHPAISVVAFKNGKAMHWATAAAEAGKATCYLIVPNQAVPAVVRGFSFKIAALEIKHSHRTHGAWHLENTTDTETANLDRSNSSGFKLEGAPEGFSLSCDVKRGPEVIVVSDILSAFGSLVQFVR